MLSRRPISEGYNQRMLQGSFQLNGGSIVGICLHLKAVTNNQLNDFSGDSQALKKFLESTSDPRAMILKVFGNQAQNQPAFSELGRALGGDMSISKNAAVQDSSPQIDLDKVWHGLHWIFTGSADAGPEPLCYLLHKGLVLGRFRDGDVRGISSEQLAAFEDEVRQFDEVKLQQRYDGAAMAAANLYFSNMWQKDSEEGFEALSTGLEKLKIFLKEGRVRNEGMVIWTT